MCLLCYITVSCLAEEGPLCGCEKSTKINNDECLLYDVVCPPSNYKPSGYTKVRLSM